MDNVTGVMSENNEYELRNFVMNAENPIEDFQRVVFYKMFSDGSYENGTTLEEMLRVSIERLADLNSRFECKENIEAINHMKEALFWLNQRTADRQKRGVEGKHSA